MTSKSSKKTAKKSRPRSAKRRATPTRSTRAAAVDQDVTAVDRVDRVDRVDPPGIPATNEGQRLLRELGKSGPAIAAAAGTNKQTVAKWLRGAQPSARYRAALDVALGIPRDAWDRRPAAPKPQTRTDAPTHTSPADEPVGGKFARRRATMAEVEQLLAEVRAKRAEPDLVAREYVQLAAVEARLIAQRAKLEEAEKLDERALVDSPSWQHFRAALAKAVLEHGTPEMARAISDALRAAHLDRTGGG